MIDKLFSGAGSLLGKVGGNTSTGASIGGLFGPQGAVIGGAAGLIADLVDDSAEQELRRERERKRNLKQFAQDRSTSQALRADWMAKSNPVQAFEYGGDTDVQAMVAPGEVVVTNDGYSVNVKGKGNKDNVPWTGGPATVFGNLKMQDGNMTFKDFAKKHFKEIKRGTQVMPGTLQARAIAAEILGNMQKQVQQDEDVMPKTATVTKKNLKNAKNASVSKRVPAAYNGEDVETDWTELAVKVQNQALIDAARSSAELDKDLRDKRNAGQNVQNVLGKLGQLTPALWNIAQGQKQYEISPVNRNRNANAALSRIGRNTYDLRGNMQDDVQQTRSALYNTRSLGNSTGVQQAYSVATHANTLKNRRNLFHNNFLAQNAVNQQYAEMLHKIGAEDVAAENLAYDQTLQNKAARNKFTSTGVGQLGNAFGTFTKDYNKMLADKKYIYPYLSEYLSHGSVNPLAEV